MQQDAFEFPTCIPRLFRRLDWKLETASDSKSTRLSSHHKSQRQRLREAHHLRHVLRRVRAGFPSHSLLFESAVMNVQQFRQFG
jgi:Ser/Thr protein kinase RdoA (MazF antagonist)